MRASDIAASEYDGQKFMGKYKTDWVCDNCFQKFKRYIARGHKRPPLSECPNCGCLTHGRNYG